MTENVLDSHLEMRITPLTFVIEFYQHIMQPLATTAFYVFGVFFPLNLSQSCQGNLLWYAFDILKQHTLTAGTLSKLSKLIASSY